MKENKLLGALLPSSPDFAPITKSVSEKYQLAEISPMIDQLMKYIEG